MCNNGAYSEEWVGALSVSNNSAIGNGVVAYLTFTVKTGASLGVATLQNSPEASDPSGNDVPIGGANGSISAETVIYVEPNGQCGGNSPCFSTIQDEINSADTYSVIKVRWHFLMQFRSSQTCDIIIWRGGSRVVLCHGKRIKARYLKI